MLNGGFVSVSVFYDSYSIFIFFIGMYIYLWKCIHVSGPERNVLFSFS